MSYKYLTDKGTLIEHCDPYPISPREYDEGSGSTFLTFSSKYSSPDENIYSCFIDWLENSGIFTPSQAAKIDNSYRTRNLENKAAAHKLLIGYARKQGYILLPVFFYEHSGIVYQAAESNPFGDPFDSGSCGVIYTSCEFVRKARGIMRITKKIEESEKQFLINDVEDYSAYANGEVYEYELQDDNGNVISEFHSPFYGDVRRNGIMNEAGIKTIKPIGELED